MYGRHSILLAGLVVSFACRPVVFDGEQQALIGPYAGVLLDDGVVDPDEHGQRSLFNVCPATEPNLGIDEQGTNWSRDSGLAGWNPFHGGLDCFRGSSAELGISGYQCCYADGVLVDEEPYQGSFDYVNPDGNLFFLILHYLADVVPHFNYR